MSKSFCSLGLMSGTSADGIDASIIHSDGDTQYSVILDHYFKFLIITYIIHHNLRQLLQD